MCCMREGKVLDDEPQEFLPAAAGALADIVRSAYVRLLKCVVLFPIGQPPGLRRAVLGALPRWSLLACSWQRDSVLSSPAAMLAHTLDIALPSDVVSELLWEALVG